MLNPIEGVFADFKRTIRSLLSVTYAQELINIDAGPRGEKGLLRGELLTLAYHVAVDSLRHSSINSHILHLREAVERSFLMEDQ